MDGLVLLQNRVSVTKLVAPPPSMADLEQAFKAAVRAADHGKLQPWRFLVISGDGLQQLSEIYVAAALRANVQVSASVLEKCKNMPMRAPMIIVAIAKCQQHVKVPRQEQIIACGAATQNLLNALFAMGYGAVWRTGDMAYDAYVMAQLGLIAGEEIIGFVYAGTPAQEIPEPPPVNLSEFFRVWPAK